MGFGKKQSAIDSLELPGASTKVRKSFALNGQSKNDFLKSLCNDIRSPS
jgi:hypothetical protein